MLDVKDAKGKSLALGDYVAFTLSRQEPQVKKHEGKPLMVPDDKTPGHHLPAYDEPVEVKEFFIGTISETECRDDKGRIFPGMVEVQYHAHMRGKPFGGARLLAQASSLELVRHADGSAP